MKLCLCVLLLLCALTDTGYSTQLNPAALQKIVQDFVNKIGINTYNEEPKINQFSFLMALNDNQCKNGGVAYSPIWENKPVIELNPVNNIKDAHNYVAAKPDSRSTDIDNKRCAEYKLLFPSDKNPQSPAVRFQTNGDKILRGGGCVIFFTTNTPCTEKCFSDSQNCDIVNPLGENPFQNWHNMKNVNLYFVYIQQYWLDQDEKNIEDKLKQTSGKGFQISRCYNNSLDIDSCRTDCGPADKYCLQDSPQIKSGGKRKHSDSGPSTSKKRRTN